MPSFSALAVLVDQAAVSGTSADKLV